METRQPDETRKVGEEAAGALTRLHALTTKRNHYPALALAVVFVSLTFYLYGDFVVPHLIARLGGSQEGWNLVLLVVVLLSVAPLSWLYIWWRRDCVEFIVLHRGSSPQLVDVDETQVWTEQVVAIRVFLPLLAFGLSVFGLYKLLQAPTNELRVSFACGTLYFLYLAFQHIENAVYPLLIVNQEGLQTKRRKMRWEQLEGLRISNDLINNENFVWQFFDSQGTRLARVNLSSTTATRQKEVVFQIAEAMGARIEEKLSTPAINVTAAPPSTASLD